MSESKMTIDGFGNKRWKNSARKYHRTEGPAVERANGDKEWWVNGCRHRTDGPAIEYSNGDKMWWVNGNFFGFNDKGFWELWKGLTPEQKKDPVLLSYLPEKF